MNDRKTYLSITSIFASSSKRNGTADRQDDADEHPMSIRMG